jgi:hypothetical protein
MIKWMDETFQNINALIEAIYTKGLKAIDILMKHIKSRRS